MKSNYLVLTLLAFNWLAPLDEKCLGPFTIDGHEASVECFDYSVGVVVYDVRLG